MFAKDFFVAEGLPFSDEAFDDLYARFDGVTWYVQSVMNRVWQKGTGFTGKEDTEAAVRALVDNRSLVFFDLFRSQTENARAVLCAVASDGIVATPTGKEFVAGHSLGAASTVASVIDNLIGRELLYRTDKGYIVYDRLFALWLNRQVGFRR